MNFKYSQPNTLNHRVFEDDTTVIACTQLITRLAYSSTPLLMEERFQDPQWTLESTDSTISSINCVIPVHTQLG